MKLMLFFILLLTMQSLDAQNWNDPVFIENKVQSELAETLSKILPKYSFLVQARAEASIKYERKLMEGETIEHPREKELEPPFPLPGFYPEPQSEIQSINSEKRQVYKLIETPEISKLRVFLKLDRALSTEEKETAKKLTHDYLQNQYSFPSLLQISDVPMLKPEIKKEELKLKNESEKPITKKEPSASDKIWSYMRWLMPLLLVALFFIVLFKKEKEKQNSQLPYFDPFSERRKSSETQATSKTQESGEKKIEDTRKKMLNRLLNHAEAFKSFYETLAVVDKQILLSSLSGPALDDFLKSLHISRPKHLDALGSEEQNQIHSLDKNFEEYIQMRAWKEKQFFGFLENLSNEQLLAFTNQLSTKVMGILIRFLTPQQSAALIHSVSKDRKMEIMKTAASNNKVPFSELMTMERQLRMLSQQISNFHSHQGLNDVEFWGNILNETAEPDALIDILEQTNPNITPNLKKFRFSLEDAATLPNNILEKVLKTISNDELALALSTCKPETAEVLLDAVPLKRRELIIQLVESQEGDDKDKTNAAKVFLTRKIREAIA